MEPVRRFALLIAAVAAVLAIAVSPALANEPAWTIVSASSPTNFLPGDKTGDDAYVLTVVNSGTGSTGLGEVDIADQLPAGLSAADISGEDLGNEKRCLAHSHPRSAALTKASK